MVPASVGYEENLVAHKDLSIVIPALNEAAKIKRDIEAASAFLIQAKLAGEVIVVDDGSEDDTAARAERTPVPDGVVRKVIRRDDHHGKGFAVRSGVAASTGTCILFADSGCCIPYAAALDGMALINKDLCEVAHASRKMVGTIIEQPQPLYRRWCSKLFAWGVRRALGVPSEMTDTQCGFKLYKGDVGRKLFAKCVVDGFMFDVEVLLRARRAGYRIAEFPVRWHCDHDSRLRPVHAAIRSFKELREIRQAMRELDMEE